MELLREEWIKDIKLRKWDSVSCTEKSVVTCKCDGSNHIVLWEQDSCVRGRIDTTVCNDCDTIVSFKIVR